MYNLKFKYIMLLLLSLTLQSCSGTKGTSDRFITRQVSAHELVGDWELSIKTIELIKCKDNFNSVFLKKSQFITLNEDYTCIIEMYPYMSSVLYSKFYIDKTYQCKWELTKVVNYINHNMTDVYAIKIFATKEIQKSEKLIVNSKTITLFIAEVDGNLILWDYIGDVDFENFREFENRKYAIGKLGTVGVLKKPTVSHIISSYTNPRIISSTEVDCDR